MRYLEQLNSFNKTERSEWRNHPITIAMIGALVEIKDELLDRTMVTEPDRRNQLVDQALGIDLMIGQMVKYGNMKGDSSGE